MRRPWRPTRDQKWFLVLWGGTRKGSGTFYTRPQLAVPTVMRTLRPLAYDPPASGDEAPLAEWTPKAPNVLLALKGMGHALLGWGVPVLPAACRRWAIAACGVDILPRAEIGGGAIVAHGLGLVVGGRTVIGRDCTLLHGVTLGTFCGLTT